MSAALSCGLFAAFAVGACVAAYRPPDRGENFNRKMEGWLEAREAAEVVAIGTSMIESSFHPETFEAATGRPAFNFGLPRCRGYQMEAVLESILATRPASLQVVLIEVSDWPTGVLDPQYAPSWHTPGRTLRAMAWDAEQGDCEGALERLGALARRYTPLARGLPPPGPPQREYRQVTGAGFRALSEASMPLTDRRRVLLGLEGDAVAVPEFIGNAVNVGGLEAIGRRCREAGLEPVFVRPPNGQRYAGESPEDYAELGALGFDDPGAHPELFLKEHRWDPNHMNPEGAAVFTRKLAARLGEGAEARADGKS